MLLLKWVFVILHVITASAWFGLALPLARRARLVAAGGPAAAALAEEGSRTVRMLGVFAVLTFVFGLIALFLGGGFGAYDPQYHTSMLLILILIGIHYGLVRPGWNALGSGGQKRVAMGIGIGHLIWLVVLVLMFWRWLAPAAAAS